jgi:hypothetical protein
MVVQQLLQQSITATEIQVNIATLPTGVYFVIFKGEGGDFMKKFVKM